MKLIAVMLMVGCGGDDGASRPATFAPGIGGVPAGSKSENGVPVIEDSREFWCHDWGGECDDGMFQGSDMKRAPQVACIEWTNKFKGGRRHACYRTLGLCADKREDLSVKDPSICTIVRHKAAQ